MGNNGDLNDFLDEIDREEEVWQDRIFESLQIDGETHPTRDQVGKELTKLHGRRKPRSSSPKASKQDT